MRYTLFDMFKFDCKENPADVLPRPAALDNARETYKLNTKKLLLEFIGNGGLEDVAHINTKAWKNNPFRSGNPLDAHAYNCRTVMIPCYLSIVFIRSINGKQTNKWVIKSFHVPDDADQPMLGQLIRLGFSHSENNDD